MTGAAILTFSNVLAEIALLVSILTAWRQYRNDQSVLRPERLEFRHDSSQGTPRYCFKLTNRAKVNSRIVQLWVAYGGHPTAGTYMNDSFDHVIDLDFSQLQPRLGAVIKPKAGDADEFVLDVPPQDSILVEDEWGPLRERLLRTKLLSPGSTVYLRPIALFANGRKRRAWRSRKVVLPL